MLHVKCLPVENLLTQKQQHHTCNIPIQRIHTLYTHIYEYAMFPLANYKLYTHIRVTRRRYFHIISEGTFLRV